MGGEVEVGIPIILVIFLYMFAIIAATADWRAGIAAFAGVSAFLISLVWALVKLGEQRGKNN